MHQFQLKFVRDFEADVWSRFWSRFVKLRYGRSLVEILRLKFGGDFEVEV